MAAQISAFIFGMIVGGFAVYVIGIVIPKNKIR
jgi:hypothetical protein